MVGTLEQNAEAYDKWNYWLRTSAHGMESLEGWPICTSECTYDCKLCLWYLVDMEEEQVGEFLESVKRIVENLVEELYLHPNWSTDEYNEYGYEMGFLVEMYFEYELGQLTR